MGWKTVEEADVMCLFTDTLSQWYIYTQREREGKWKERSRHNFCNPDFKKGNSKLTNKSFKNNEAKLNVKEKEHDSTSTNLLCDSEQVHR